MNPWREYMKNTKKKMLLIAGKSGSGKTYIARMFGLKMVVSNTTRPIRKDAFGEPMEFDGVDYHFHKQNKLPAANKYCAHTRRDGYFFWITPEDLKNCDAFIVDIPGVTEMMSFYGLEFYDKFEVIYFDCPLWKRIRNMRRRGTSWLNIIRRLYVDRSFNDIKYMSYRTIKF